jgi:hypothetical protein
MQTRDCRGKTNAIRGEKMIIRSLSTGLFVILFSFGLCMPAQAIVFAPALNYTTAKEDNSETSSLIADLRLGTVIGTSFYVGGIYHIQRDDSNGSSTNAWAAGPTAGLYLGNFSLIFSYHLISERQTPSVKYTEGKGPQVDVAYAFDLGSGVKMGPQITWRELQYDAPTTKTVGSLRPYVAFFFEF